MLVAGGDPLRDEGNEYAEKLKAAGVDVTYRYFPGQFHGFFTMGKLLNQANVAATRDRRLAEGAGLDRGALVESLSPRSRSPSTR